MPCFLFAWALKSDSLSFCKRTNRILPKYSLERNEELAVLLLLSYFYYPLSWPLVFWQLSKKKCSHNFAVSQEWQVHGEFWVFCQRWVTQAHGFFLRTSWNGHRKVLTWRPCECKWYNLFPLVPEIRIPNILGLKPTEDLVLLKGLLGKSYQDDDGTQAIS